MKNAIGCFVFLFAATLSSGCSQGTSFDDPALAAPPPLAPSSSPEKMTTSEKAMLETMSPGGIADPDRQI